MNQTDLSIGGYKGIPQTFFLTRFLDGLEPE